MNSVELLPEVPFTKMGHLKGHFAEILSDITVIASSVNKVSMTVINKDGQRENPVVAAKTALQAIDSMQETLRELHEVFSGYLSSSLDVKN